LPHYYFDLNGLHRLLHLPSLRHSLDPDGRLWLSRSAGHRLQDLGLHERMRAKCPLPNSLHRQARHRLQGTVEFEFGFVVFIFFFVLILVV
jgi:preprotein translocase subunit YajC